MKLAVRSNYRVVVNTPDWRYHGKDDDDTHKTMIRHSQEIEEQIKRHCSIVICLDGGSTEVKWDTDYTCSYCGLTWEVVSIPFDYGTGLPICCQAAQADYLDEENEK